MCEVLLEFFAQETVFSRPQRIIFAAEINRASVSVIPQCVRSAHSLTVITLLQRMFHYQKDAANRPQPLLLRALNPSDQYSARVRPGFYRC
jgi:hypothetical protein